MSEVAKCQVNKCAYNKDGICHALSITIGDSTNPKCDTYCESEITGGDQSYIATVGACKVSTCVYNIDLECQSPGICVGYKGDEPDCLTYESQQYCRLL